MEPDEPSIGSDKSHRRHKLLALFGIAAVAMLLAWQFGDYLKLDYLATQETNLREIQTQHPVLVCCTH